MQDTGIHSYKRVNSENAGVIESRGCPETNQKFSEQFETIFQAALSGDLKACQEVIDKDLISCGEVHYSPSQVAQIIIELAQKAKKENITSVKVDGLQNRDLLYARIIEKQLQKHYSSLPSQKESVPNIQFKCISTKKVDICWNNKTDQTDEWHISAKSDEITVTNKITKKSSYISKAHLRTITSLCLQKERFFSASEDQTLKAWDVKSGECLKTFVGHTKEVLSLCVQGNLLISGSEDNNIKIWNIKTGGCLKTLQGHSSKVCAVAVYGKFIVSASWDSSIKIWSIESGECLRTLNDHINWVRTLLIHDGLIYSGSDDRTIKIWDFEGQCLNTLGAEFRVIKLWIEEGKLISLDVKDVIQVWAV